MLNGKSRPKFSDMSQLVELWKKRSCNNVNHCLLWDIVYFETINSNYYCLVGRNSSLTTAHCVLDPLDSHCSSVFLNNLTEFPASHLHFAKSWTWTINPQPKEGILAMPREYDLRTSQLNLRTELYLMTKKCHCLGNGHTFSSGAAVCLMSWGQKMNAGLDVYSLCYFRL